MKILHTVENYYPSQGGMQEVVKQLSERLVKLGHKVTVATSKNPQRKSSKINGVSVIEFDIKGKIVEGLIGETEKYKDFLLNSRFDIITNFAAQQWATDIILPILDEVKAKKVFVPTGFSALYNPKYKKYFDLMETWMKKYDMNVFLSNNYRDIRYAKKHGVKKIILIPNGAGKDEFLSQNVIDIRNRFKISHKDFLILLIGSHTGLKGHTEAISIFSKARIKDTTFLIIANSFQGGCTKSCRIKNISFNISPKRLTDNKRIIITFLSRKETISALKQSDLFLFPSNIECSPLVLFESVAAKLPFLTTDVGNAKEIIKWTNGGKLLPTIKDKNGYSYAEIDKSAKMLEFFYAHPDKRKTIARNGFKKWSRNFTWEKITKDYEKLYQRLIK